LVSRWSNSSRSDDSASRVFVSSISNSQARAAWAHRPWSSATCSCLSSSTISADIELASWDSSEEMSEAASKNGNMRSGEGNCSISRQRVLGLPDSFSSSFFRPWY
jgi:hypothetical protein